LVSTEIFHSGTAFLVFKMMEAVGSFCSMLTVIAQKRVPAYRQLLFWTLVIAVSGIFNGETFSLLISSISLFLIYLYSQALRSTVQTIFTTTEDGQDLEGRKHLKDVLSSVLEASNTIASALSCLLMAGAIGCFGLDVAYFLVPVLATIVVASMLVADWLRSRRRSA
jgi:hypothetical protein